MRALDQEFMRIPLCDAKATDLGRTKAELDAALAKCRCPGLGVLFVVAGGPRSPAWPPRRQRAAEPRDAGSAEHGRQPLHQRQLCARHWRQALHCDAGPAQAHGRRLLVRRRAAAAAAAGPTSLADAPPRQMIWDSHAEVIVMATGIVEVRQDGALCSSLPTPLPAVGVRWRAADARPDLRRAGGPSASGTGRRSGPGRRRTGASRWWWSGRSTAASMWRRT